MEIKEELIQQFKGQTRLQQFAVPKRYDLTLKLDLPACTFSGRVAIDASVNDPTKFLVLNALELAVQQKYVPSDIVVDSDDEILVLVFEEVLEVGSGLLEIEFSGVLNEHLKGLYRCTYSDKGEKKNMAASQFEAVDGRRCFPCWDEPALKATFKITLENIPSELTALSNMPVSILMSTYLGAVVVGLFDYVEDTTEDGSRENIAAIYN